MALDFIEKVNLDIGSITGILLIITWEGLNLGRYRVTGSTEMK